MEFELNNPRNERVLTGCLLMATQDREVVFPQKDVIICGLTFCNARSDHQGELPCRQLLNKRNPPVA